MTDRAEGTTNGRRPRIAEPESPPPELPLGEPEPSSAAPAALPVGFSPPQLAIGAAVIAAVLLIGFRRLRRRR